METPSVLIDGQMNKKNVCGVPPVASIVSVVVQVQSLSQRSEVRMQPHLQLSLHIWPRKFHMLLMQLRQREKN